MQGDLGSVWGDPVVGTKGLIHDSCEVIRLWVQDACVCRAGVCASRHPHLGHWEPHQASGPLCPVEGLLSGSSTFSRLLSCQVGGTQDPAALAGS